MNQPDQDDRQRLEDERFMWHCIRLAKVAFEQGNTPAGSIVVVSDSIISEGIESLPMGSDVTGHAELIAIQNAVSQLESRQLCDSTLYTTAEPCFMCSYVIRNAEIARVVYCLDTPLIGGVTSDHPILGDGGLNGWKPPPEIVAGILADDFLTTKKSWATNTS